MKKTFVNQLIFFLTSNKDASRELQSLQGFIANHSSKLSDQRKEYSNSLTAFVQAIQENRIPEEYQSPNLLNSLLQTIPYYSELKTKDEILTGKMSRDEMIARVLGNDLTSMVNHRLMDVSIVLGADINSVNTGIPVLFAGTINDGLPALHGNISCNQYSATKFLLQRGADLNKHCIYGLLPLHYAFAGQRAFTVKENSPTDILYNEYIKLNTKYIRETLVSRAKDVDVLSKEGKTALHYASESPIRHGMDTVKLLIDRGANVNMPDPNGNSPLHLAVKFGNENMAKLLLSNRANVNLQNKFGETPLHIATKDKRKEIISLLIDHHADNAILDSQGKTPFGYLEQHKDMDLKIRLDYRIASPSTRASHQKSNEFTI